MSEQKKAKGESDLEFFASFAAFCKICTRVLGEVLKQVAMT